MTEERVTSSTGGAKGKKLAQLGSLDPKALLEVAEVSGYGAEKYGERYNFMRGYDWSLSYDALQRHLHQFWSGDNTDPESGLPHLAHAAWHCLALLHFSREHPGFDDRPSVKPPGTKCDYCGRGVGVVDNPHHLRVICANCASEQNQRIKSRERK